MIQLLACLWILLPLQALGDNLVIPAEPARVDIPDVKFYRIAYGFEEDETGRFQLHVNFRYRPWTSHIKRVKHLTFRLQSGTIVQGDDQTLVLYLDNRERVVGRHRWWYNPYWQAADDVRIACDSKRQIRRVILENCRLMIKKPAFNETHGRDSPATEGMPIAQEVNFRTSYSLFIWQSRYLPLY